MIINGFSLMMNEHKYKFIHQCIIVYFTFTINQIFHKIDLKKNIYDFINISNVKKSNNHKKCI